jgi:hypothetical protein
MQSFAQVKLFFSANHSNYRAHPQMLSKIREKMVRNVAGSDLDSMQTIV